MNTASAASLFRVFRRTRLSRITRADIVCKIMGRLSRSYTLLGSLNNILSLLMLVNFTTHSLAVRCPQPPCYSLKKLAVSTQKTAKELSNQEFTGNDLSPIMEDTDRYSFAQDYKNETHKTSIPIRKRIPEYMLDLYDNKIERVIFGNSFENVRMYKASTGFKDSYIENIYQRSNTSSVHHLLFNISDISTNERVQVAQLKLWAVVNCSSGNKLGVRRLFRIYLTNGYTYNPWDLEILDFKSVLESENLWLTFNVTHAVKWWMDQKIGIKMLQVRIDPINPSEVKFGSIEIKLQTQGLEPQLVVYSSSDSGADQITGRVSNRDRRSMHKNQRKTKSSPNCRRRSLYVNFTIIKYDEWIVAPEGFEAYECAGRCDFPLSDHLTPTRHSIIQSLIHTIQPDRVGKICCVPIRLDPISLLYFDEQGVLTYKYRYEEMVVAECGCR